MVIKKNTSTIKEEEFFEDEEEYSIIKPHLGKKIPCSPNDHQKLENKT